MNAGDVMTPKVVSVVPEASILEAMQSMLANRISGLPVITESAKLVGIVTEGDFVRRAETGTQHRRSRWLELIMGPGKLAQEYVHTHGRKVSEVMTPEPVTITEDTPLDVVVCLLEERRIKRLPVVRSGVVVGIVSRANLLHALASRAREQPNEGEPMRQSARRSMPSSTGSGGFPRISSTSWCVTQRLRLGARSSTNASVRRCRSLVENVPGVKHISDHLVWVEPMSGTAFEPVDETAGGTKQD